MGKGSGRRKENYQAIIDNWPDMSKKKEDTGEIKMNWREKLGSQIDRVKGMKNNKSNTER